jgi:DNA-binding protein Fis
MRALRVKKSVLCLSEDPAKLILDTLRKTRGCILHAAHEIGINRETLRLWIKRLDLYPEIRKIRHDCKMNQYNRL